MIESEINKQQIPLVKISNAPNNEDNRAEVNKNKSILHLLPNQPMYGHERL